MKLLIDVSKLEAEGKVTPDQASEIRAIAAAETTSLAINLLSFLGIAAIVGGVVALAPSALVAGSLGAGLIAFGLWLRWFKSGTFGLLGNSLTLIGALLHCGAVLAERCGTGRLAWQRSLVCLCHGCFTGPRNGAETWPFHHA